MASRAITTPLSAWAELLRHSFMRIQRKGDGQRKIWQSHFDKITSWLPGQGFKSQILIYYVHSYISSDHRPRLLGSSAAWESATYFKMAQILHILMAFRWPRPRDKYPIVPIDRRNHSKWRRFCTSTKKDLDFSSHAQWVKLRVAFSLRRTQS